MAKLHLLVSLLLLMVLNPADIFSQGSWERVTVPSGQFFRSVSFPDSLYGWVVGDSGAIIHTTDGGTTWTVQDGHTANDIVSVFFLNREIGWASSFNYSVLPYGTLLLHTVNGGQDWTGVPYPVENIFITCILFTDTLTGWMGGKPHALVKTVNGGADWVQATIDTSILAFFPVLGIKFYNEKYGFACGGMFDIAGVTWRTTDGGETWAAMDVSDAPADEVHQLHIYDSLHVMGAGGDPDFGYGVGLLRTGDGGINWDYEELGIQGTAYDIAFRNDSEVWAPLGPRRKLIRSMDGGSTWTELSTPDSVAVYHMTFPDSLHGYAVGAAGACLRYRPTGNLGIPGSRPDVADAVTMSNFPNPFDRLTTVRYTVPGNARRYVTIMMSDLFGRHVATLVNGWTDPGAHEVQFDAGSLPAGIYLCRPESSDEGQTVLKGTPLKLVIMK